MKAAFAPIDELLRTFGPATSATFVCWQYRGRLTRNLRCGDGQNWMEVVVHEVGTDWSRALRRRLLRAGYTAEESDDKLLFRRYWHDARDRDRELAFVRSLGELGTPAKWPVRAQKRQNRRDMSAHDVKQVVASAKRSRIEWDHMALVISRRCVSRDEVLRVLVHILVDVEPRPYVNLYLNTKSEDAKRFESARRAMRAAGFNGGRPPQPWFGARNFRSIATALHARDAILKRLL